MNPELKEQDIKDAVTSVLKISGDLNIFNMFFTMVKEVSQTFLNTCLLNATKYYNPNMKIISILMNTKVTKSVSDIASVGPDNFEEVMQYAVEGGHIDIVRLLIQKGVTNFNWAMVHAACRGHIDIVCLLIDEGATDFDGALRYAADGGHIDIVKLMIQKGVTNFNCAMEAAAEGGHTKIVKVLQSFL